MTLPPEALPTQTLAYEELFLRLQNGHQLVTGNSRLTRVLTGKYAQWRAAKGDLQWPSPRVMSWGQWLHECWEAASLQGIDGFDRAVPNQRQLTSLWESTLRSSSVKHNLLQPESLASQLRDTRKLIREWRLSLNDPAWSSGDNENHMAFRQWNKTFETLCEQGNWLPPEDRGALLIAAIATGKLLLSGCTDLLGFDEFNPQQADLLAAMQAQGLQLCQLNICARQSRAYVWKSSDGKAELQKMARWARHHLTQNPVDSIAVVVPDLPSRRREVERHLQEILAPGEEGNASIRPWNISMGTSLARVPMIQAAFDLLTLLDESFDITDVSRILSSPWLRGAKQERYQRALLEKRLRDKHPRQLKLSDIRYRCSEIKDTDRYGKPLPEPQHTPQRWNSPQLLNIVRQLQTYTNNHQNSMSASSWAESFDRLLHAVGWWLVSDQSEVSDHAGTSANERNRERRSHDWQVLQAWRDALGELASLDATGVLLSRANAIGQIQHICREMIFQPQSPAASIQVLGLYEVNGLRFDHLWVTGLHNDNWPTSARPNPFIPGKLQLDAGMPGSSPQRELEVARVITRRLLRTADNIIFSYPGKIDGEEVSASPLLKNTTPLSDHELVVWEGDSWLDAVAAATAPVLESMLMPGPMVYGTARGGSSILRHQALCPFRAFASNRLGAEGLEIPVDGISPSLHGSLLHKVLELFWTETVSQAALLALSEDQLNGRVRTHVDAVVAGEYGLKQRPAFRQVEADRICRLVLEYLKLEVERDPFEVKGFEQEVLPVIEGQTIRLIIDRIDEAASGAKIIIDYKTGKVDPKKWFGNRPEDPQMPLYAISVAATPAALAFAVIRDEKCEFKGIASETGLLPDLPPRDIKANHYLLEAGNDMPLTLDNWRSVMHRLMSEFLAGDARVDPKSGLKTCKQSYCQLQSLCRVGELVLRQQSLPSHNKEQGQQQEQGQRQGQRPGHGSGQGKGQVTT